MSILILELETFIRGDRVPPKRFECIRGLLTYLVRTYKWIMLYIKGLRMTTYGRRKGRDKDLYKTKSQLWVCMKVWEWEP